MRAWQKSQYEAIGLRREKREAEQQLAALIELHPIPAFWQPRKTTAADRRIARQYEETATPRNFRFVRARDVDDYAARVERRRGIEVDTSCAVAYAKQRQQIAEEVAIDLAARPLREALRQNLTMRSQPACRATIRRLIDDLRLAECGIVCHPENDLPDPRDAAGEPMSLAA